MALKMKALAVLVLAAAPGRAFAPPPPPAIPPVELRTPIDGYNLQQPYQAWVSTVERQKGAAIDELMKAAEDMPGERPIGDTLVAYDSFNDSGHFASGEIQTYCKSGGPTGYDKKTCHYRYRTIRIPPSANAYPPDNPVARWTHDSFDAAKVVAHLKATGVAPGTANLWSAGVSTVMPSPVSILKENAKITVVDSRDCPAFHRAVEALEGKTLSVALDFLAIGRDDDSMPPIHGVQTDYSISSWAPSSGGRVEITGHSDRIQALVDPVFTAADSCIKPAR